MVHENDNQVTENTNTETEVVQDTYKEQFLRLNADFQNYKRRVEKERIDWMLISQTQILEQILPVFDELDRAISLAEKHTQQEANSWLEGLKLVQKRWQKVFETLGIQEIVATGEFNPELHEAIMQVEQTEVASHHIVQCFEKGYTFKGKVVRHAKVSVAQ